MSNLDHQLQAVGSGQAVGESLRPVRLEMLAHLFHGMQDQQKLGWINGGQRSGALYEGRANETEHVAGQRIPGYAGDRSLLPCGYVPDRGTKLREMRGRFF